MQMMVDSSMPLQEGTKERRKRDKLAVRACVLCNQAHTACDDQRPCKRCVTKGIPHLCQDIEPRKRGRPAKLPEQYDRDVQAAIKRTHVASSSSPSSALQLFQSNNAPYPFEPVSSPLLLDFETSSSLFSDINMNADMMDPQLFNVATPPQIAFQSDVSSYAHTTIVNNSFTPTRQPTQQQQPQYQVMQQPSPLPVPSPIQPQQPQQSPIQPTIPKYFEPVPIPQKVECSNSMTPSEMTFPSSNPTSTIAPPGFGATSSCSSSKFTEAHLNQVFLRLANKAGYNEITPELRLTMNKIITFYAPLVQQYGTNLLDMCPVRLMSVTQMFAEMSLPVVVAGCFFLLTANQPALELTGIKKSEIGPMAPTKKFIFDIIHRDDAIPFVMKSVDCLTSFTDLDRMKIRLMLPSGMCHCIISETIHRNTNGVPLFSSFTFVRIDDL